MSNSLTNTQILCFVLGWQGGTIHQVAEVLMVSANDILYANEQQMNILCLEAQKRVANQYPTILLFLGLCIDNLKLDYRGHTYPTWLQKAVDLYNHVKGMV